jgi:hypothetical protein
MSTASGGKYATLTLWKGPQWITNKSHFEHSSEEKLEELLIGDSDVCMKVIPEVVTTLYTDINVHERRVMLSVLSANEPTVSASSV